MDRCGGLERSGASLALRRRTICYRAAQHAETVNTQLIRASCNRPEFPHCRRPDVTWRFKSGRRDSPDGGSVELSAKDRREEKIRGEIAARELKVLSLEDRCDAFAEIYLVVADPEGAGPGVRRLAAILKEDAWAQCTNSLREGTRTRKRQWPAPQFPANHK